MFGVLNRNASHLKSPQRLQTSKLEFVDQILFRSHSTYIDDFENVRFKFLKKNSIYHKSNYTQKLFYSCSRYDKVLDTLMYRR